MLWTPQSGRMACLMVLTAMLAIGTPAFAQSASELLQQGLNQVEQGQYTQAQTTLNRIDRVQLSDAERTQLDQAQQQVAGYLNASQQLSAAQAAESGGNLQQAKELYRQITADTSAPRRIRQEALNGLARVERVLMGGDAPAPATNVQTVEVVAESQPEGVDTRYIEPVSDPAPTTTSTSTSTSTSSATSSTATVVEVEPDTSGILAQARQLRTQQLIAEAQAAAQAGDYTKAMGAYQQALANDPQNTQAQEGLANVQAASRSTGSILDVEGANLRIRLDRERRRYANHIEASREALAAGNYALAADEASLARSILDTHRQLFPEAEYRRLRQDALDLATRIQTEGEDARVQVVADEQRQIAAQQAQDRRQAEREQQEQVQELLARARDLSREQSYEQALEQLEQVLFIDRNNAAAKFMRDLITDQLIQTRWAEVKRQRGVEMAKTRLEAIQDTVPHTELLIYPADWPELTRRRLAGIDQFADSEANRITREKLRQPIPVDFQANRLENVIEYLRNVTGANFFVQWRALEAAGIARDTPITMQLQNVAADNALRLILNEAGGDLVRVDYTIDDGVVIIATKDFLAQNTVLRTYDIRDLTFQAPRFNDPPEFDLAEITSGDSAQGGSGGTSIFGDTTTDAPEQISPAERTNQIMDLMRNSVDPNGWRQAGGLTSSMEELSGSLIVNTTVENHNEIMSLLRMLREQQALQIVVESRFLFVTQNFLEEVGMDVDILLQNDGSGWMSRHIVGNPGISQTSADRAGARGTTVDGTLAPLAGEAALTFGAIGAGGVVSPLGFILDDLQVNVLIRATQEDVRNITLNTPRLTIFNNDLYPAYITISRQIAFVSDLEPIVATNSVAFDPTISVVQDGITLAVKGAISADRRYVRLYVRPSMAQLVALREFAVFSQTAVGDDDDDPDDPNAEPRFGVGLIQQPEISVTTLETQVSVPDKGTLLLGGQRLIGEVEVESGVPVMSKIPFLNRLFTNRAITRDEKTLLILVQPTIIIQSEQEEILFPGLNQSPNLYGGLGSRQ